MVWWFLSRRNPVDERKSTPMRELTTEDELQAAFDASHQEAVFLFKHSTRCPISTDAYTAFRNYLDRAGARAVPSYLVKVIESRPVSNRIAQELGVTHQSPQLILVKGGAATWTANHYGINEDAIASAAEAHAPA